MTHDLGKNAEKIATSRKISSDFVLESHYSVNYQEVVGAFEANGSIRLNDKRHEINASIFATKWG
jgi:hypothetical protein